MESEVHTFYGGKTRLRVCGFVEQGEKLLMINHLGISKVDFWAPPGGGLSFGETAEECLKREVLEETGLEIKVGRFLFACELIRLPLHAIELFFMVEAATGELKTGQDPEAGSPSIIKQTKFMSWEEIVSLPSEYKHGIFNHAKSREQLVELRGFFKL